MAQFFASRNGRVILSDKKEFQRWNDLPYGMWTCADGREVLFNRFYEPIMQALGLRCLEMSDRMIGYGTVEII